MFIILFRIRAHYVVGGGMCKMKSAKTSQICQKNLVDSLLRMLRVKRRKKANRPKRTSQFQYVLSGFASISAKRRSHFCPAYVPVQPNCRIAPWVQYRRNTWESTHNVLNATSKESNQVPQSWTKTKYETVIRISDTMIRQLHNQNNCLWCCYHRSSESVVVWRVRPWGTIHQ